MGGNERKEKCSQNVCFYLENNKTKTNFEVTLIMAFKEIVFFLRFHYYIHRIGKNDLQKINQLKAMLCFCFFSLSLLKHYINRRHIFLRPKDWNKILFKDFFSRIR